MDPLDPAAAGLAAQDQAEGKATGLPEWLVAPDLVRDAGLKLSAAQAAWVLGGEAALWGELVTDEMLDHRLWPAAAALAERFWSSAGQRDLHCLYRRLGVVQDGRRLQGLADLAQRRRVAARLAPGAADAVVLFTDLVVPVRRFAHARGLRARLAGLAAPQQRLIELADIAAADSTVVWQFELSLAALLDGDTDRAAALDAELRGWQDNHPRFCAAARGRPLLAAAMPVSADIALLAGYGRQALAIITRAPDMPDMPAGPLDFLAAQALLDRRALAQAASSTLICVITTPTPEPADLLIAVSAPIARLVAAAQAIGVPANAPACRPVPTPQHASPEMALR